jgi:hypothetical protein
MTFRREQISILAIGFSLAAFGLAGISLHDAHFGADPFPRGPNFGEVLLVAGGGCLLIAAHRFIGRRTVPAMLLSMRGRGQHADSWFMRVYLHLDEHGRDLDA